MTPTGTPRLLLIEDDNHTGAAIVEWLESEGSIVSWERDGARGLEALRNSSFDVVILDWMIPVLSGLDVLKTLRSDGKKTPVLLLTARDAVEDRVQGLDSGADDYLMKPFALPELAARVRALLRRGGDYPSGPQIWTVADLEINEFTHVVTRAGTEIPLTGKEFQILVLLIKNSNRVVSRETLTREIWRGMRRATPLG
jgi:DNA-binding response OmpR family regulator